MIFSVTNDGIEWPLEVGPDLATLTVKDLVQEMTKSSQQCLLAAWSLLLSHRQDFLSNHIVRLPRTTNQEGNLEMIDEVLSSVGANDVDTSGYQGSDLDDVDFYWEKDQLDVDTVLRPDLDTPFSCLTLNDFEMGFLAENPILKNKERDKANSPPPTTLPTAQVERQTNSLCRKKVTHSEQDLTVFPTMFKKVCLKYL